MKVTYGPTKDGRHAVARNGVIWTTVDDPNEARQIAKNEAREKGGTAEFVEQGIDQARDGEAPQS